jgi:hypothetical protein
MYTLRLISEIGYKQCISYSYAGERKEGTNFQYLLSFVIPVEQENLGEDHALLMYYLCQ